MKAIGRKNSEFKGKKDLSAGEQVHVGNVNRLISEKTRNEFILKELMRNCWMMYERKAVFHRDVALFLWYLAMFLLGSMLCLFYVPILAGDQYLVRWCLFFAIFFFILVIPMLSSVLGNSLIEKGEQEVVRVLNKEFKELKRKK